MPLTSKQKFVVQRLGISGFEPAVQKLEAQLAQDSRELKIVSLVADNMHLVAVVEEV